ncbi:hypothetical protein P154DRAFT_22153 [Amniculicola lignicola CBS 123094]|uniref:Uncharacterized protein n=1 Tax=Amniculicola lignicola CBS 123094 TaxID=1392246 RepID=A0A6A5X0J9_9PLEO|nr:hypothetical protein P154DRAFT_22153 [Amniculicola lignicola CBS 123094]
MLPILFNNTSPASVPASTILPHKPSSVFCPRRPQSSLSDPIPITLVTIASGNSSRDTWLWSGYKWSGLRCKRASLNVACSNPRIFPFKYKICSWLYNPSCNSTRRVSAPSFISLLFINPIGCSGTPPSLSHIALAKLVRRRSNGGRSRNASLRSLATSLTRLVQCIFMVWGGDWWEALGYCLSVKTVPGLLRGD